MASYRGSKNWPAAGLISAILGVAGVTAIVLYVATRADVSDGSPEDRAKSVQTIAAKKPIGAADALARAADSDPSPKVRQAALASLIPMLEPKHRPVVEKAARDPDAGVRAVAAEVMGDFDDAPSVDVLIKLIENDPDEEVRLAALRSLAECNDPRAIVELMETSDKGNSRKLKLQAMKSLLRKFKGRISEERDPDDEARWRDLVQLMKWDYRIRAAYAAAGVKLVDRPQDRLGKDWHPERNQPPR